jgi:ketosteroid isomerase-like protein
MSDEETLLALDQQRRAAMAAGDAEALRDLFTEDFIYVHFNGLVDDREGYVTRVEAKHVHYLFAETREVKVRLHGDAAIISGVGRMGYERVDVESEGIVESLFVATWIRDQGRWRMGAYSSVAKPEVQPT